MTTSLRNIQNGIVIDMRGLNKAIYDHKTKQMTVGGGINTGEFANATHAQGMEVSKYSSDYGQAICIVQASPFARGRWYITH